MDRNEAIITYCDQKAKVACDRQCNKAWGSSQRPRVQLSDDEDDYAFLADHELGDAPAHPGTWEGRDTKPSSPDEFPNKWCVRECERSEMSEPGKWELPLVLPDFSRRRYNRRERQRNADLLELIKRYGEVRAEAGVYTGFPHQLGLYRQAEMLLAEIKGMLGIKE